MDERPERVFLAVDQETSISVPTDVFDRAAVAWVNQSKKALGEDLRGV
ncbi:MAG: hypothetical protein ACJA0B_001385 [Alcanivorax borkumensis]|jgi:hypothetical protein